MQNILYNKIQFANKSSNKKDLITRTFSEHFEIDFAIKATINPFLMLTC